MISRLLYKRSQPDPFRAVSPLENESRSTRSLCEDCRSCLIPYPVFPADYRVGCHFRPEAAAPT